MNRKAKAPKVEIARGFCVYLIAMGKVTKIGHSNNVRNRIKSLATSAPDALEIAHTWKMKDRAAAEAFERRLHRAFKWAKAKREWFNAEPREVRSVGDLYLTDREELGDALADMLMRLAKLEDEHEGLCRRLDYLRYTPQKAEKEEIRTEMDLNMRAQIALSREALLSGLIPNSVDQMLYPKSDPEFASRILRQDVMMD